MSYAIPTLIGKKTTLRIKVISSDAENALVKAIKGNINQPNGYYNNAKFRYDFYHLVKQPWCKFICTCKNSSVSQKTTYEMILRIITSWFNYTETTKEYRLSFHCLESFIQQERKFLGEIFYHNCKLLMKNISSVIGESGHHCFMNKSHFGFMGSSIVESKNVIIKRSDYCASPTMSIDKATHQQLLQVEHSTKRQNISMATEMNKHLCWTRSNTQKFLTRYMEGVSVKNFDARVDYYVIKVEEGEWKVIHKKVINYFTQENVPNECEDINNTFFRVRTVTIDDEGFMPDSIWHHVAIVSCVTKSTICCAFTIPYLLVETIQLLFWE